MIDLINVPQDDKFQVITEHDRTDLNYAESYLLPRCCEAPRATDRSLRSDPSRSRHTLPECDAPTFQAGADPQALDRHQHDAEGWMAVVSTMRSRRASS